MRHYDLARLIGKRMRRFEEFGKAWRYRRAAASGAFSFGINGHGLDRKLLGGFVTEMHQCSGIAAG
jgi:hypothetical protein